MDGADAEAWSQRVLTSGFNDEPAIWGKVFLGYIHMMLFWIYSRWLFIIMKASRLGSSYYYEQKELKGSAGRADLGGHSARK